MYIKLKISNNIIGEIMKVKDIMSKNLIICSHDINVINISNIMKKYNIGFIPIEKNKKIIGIVTDRDIVINMITNKINYKNKIESYINDKVINIDENEDVTKCLNTMKKKKKKRLIVTGNGKIVGVISISDIISNYDDVNEILETIKSIWKIEKSDDTYKTEIDEFYL